MEVVIQLMTYLQKLCVLNKIKSVNVKVFNILTKINDAKTLIKHISCDFKCKLHSATYNSNHQKWNDETRQCECKNYRTCKKDYSENLSTCFARIISI